MTKKKQLKLYDLKELVKFLAKYEKWYLKQQTKSGSNPGNPPPPPPGQGKP